MKYILTSILFISTLYAQNFILTNEQIKELETNKYIINTDRENKSGMIIFDVKKDIYEVMNNVLNLSAYPQKIDDVANVEIYLNSYNKVNARIFIDTFFVGFDNHVIHDINRADYTVKWHLDDEKENYFAKMQGYWKFKRVGKNTRVFYFNQLKFKSWIPSFLESYLFEEGLFKSTQWLKN